MTTRYEQIRASLRSQPRRWLITGAAGFIGSHLLEHLLRLDQSVVALDNFSTGLRSNLDEVRALVGSERWSRVSLLEGDIRDPAICRRACLNVDIVLHQAAVGSVPLSIEDPLTAHGSNVTGQLHILLAARDVGVRRVVFATSSSVYGDTEVQPRREESIGRMLSPYAASKHMGELYADVIARCYGLQSIGLRYFNVVGPRQRPDGPYAAVIPRWILSMLRSESIEVYGDGETSRDFCPVDNIVQANLLAAVTEQPDAVNRIYNVGMNHATTLNQLHDILARAIGDRLKRPVTDRRRYHDFRTGDIRHSVADISRIRETMHFEPACSLHDGLRTTIDWYLQSFSGDLSPHPPA